MTNKDWIRKVLEHDGRVPPPFHLSLSPLAMQQLAQHLGTSDIEHFLDLPLRMTGMRSIKPLYASPREHGDRVRDEFGVEWATNDRDRGVPCGPCLTEPCLSGYTFPDPAAEYRFQHLDEWCRKNATHYTMLWVGDLWERATFMCSMERLLVWLATEPGFVESLLRGITDYILKTMAILFERFSFEGIALSDDYGTQRSLLISPSAWRRFVRPRLAELFAAAQSANKTVFLHSCGNVRAIVPDLVDLGLDVLHPIQPEAMDILELKREFGGQLTFCGGLGTQQVLVEASPEEIRREVHRLQYDMGRGGGYILEPGITVQADVPLQNILALIDAARIRQ